MCLYRHSINIGHETAFQIGKELQYLSWPLRRNSTVLDSSLIHADGCGSKACQIDPALVEIWRGRRLKATYVVTPKGKARKGEGKSPARFQPWMHSYRSCLPPVNGKLLATSRSTAAKDHRFAPDPSPLPKDQKTTLLKRYA